MAKKVPSEMIPHITKSSPRTDYNWQQYADGDWWELRRGQDYQVQTLSARTSAENWAKKEGYKADIGNLKEHDGFVIRFTR